jgi:hypothetical protein
MKDWMKQWWSNNSDESLGFIFLMTISVIIGLIFILLL